MSRLFKWGAQLTVAKVSRDPGSYFVTRDEVTITDLRIAFAIEKQLHQAPNTSTISVYNLSDETRALFSGSPLQVRLDAGYDGEMRRLFVGDVVYGMTEQEGPDRATRLHLGDGARAYKQARLNRTYPAGTDAVTVLTDLAKSMGGKLPTNAKSAAALVKQFASAITVSGPSRHEMTRVLDRAGMSWSFQDGNLQVLGEDEARDGEALLIAEETGLLEVKYGTPQKGKPAPLTVRTLLYPEISPGRLIVVRSRDINGTFKVERVQHNGDSRGADWTTSIEAVTKK